MAKEKKKTAEDWIQHKWRPMMAIMYMVVCIFDFIIFPIGFTIVQFWETQASNDAFRQWQPLTLVGAGLFHMAMGAVLGITAWSRGQEKLAGVATNSNFGMPGGQQPMYGNQQPMGSYGSTNYTGYESSYETISVQPVTGYKGKKAPVQPPEPEL